MSDAGLDADLRLDIRLALEQVARLEASLDRTLSGHVIRVTADTSEVASEITGAVDAADSNVIVTSDAGELTGDITGAVDAADSNVVVTGDAAELTGDITGAVDAADSEVVVTGDTAELTGGITGAVDAADSDVIVQADVSDVTASISNAVQTADTQVTITANDDGDLASLGESAQLLSGALAATAASGTEAAEGVGSAADSAQLAEAAFTGAEAKGVDLGRALRLVASAAVAKQLFDAATAASDLGESTSKATVVFGQSIGEIKEFGETSAESIGLSNQAALEATGTFGNLFTALGTTKEQAADLAPDVVSLGADLASFNNLGVEDTLEKLRSGLVGEIEPLRSLGISFGAAEVDAKAMELGLVGANGEITEGAKLQARWALILEQSSTAQGDFSRTSSGLANQQRILTAEFQDAVATLGQALLPALLDGVGVAREELIPTFLKLGEDVLPAVAKAFISLLPLAGSFSSLLLTLAPVITTAADALASLPPELITVIGLMIAFRKLGDSNFVGGLVKGFQDLADPSKGPGGFGKSLKSNVGDMIAANAASVGLSLGLAAIGLAFQEEAEKAAEFERQVRQVTTALDTALEPGVNVVDALAATFEDLVKQGNTGANVLAKVGITSEEFATTVAKGGDLTEAWARSLGLTTDELGILRPFLDRFNQQVNDAAAAQVEAIKASGELDEGFVNTAISANTQQEAMGKGTDAAVDYVAVLGTLTEEQNRLAQQIGVTVDETGQLVRATGPAADAAAVLALSLEQVRTNGGNLGLELSGLASAAGNARVAEEDLQNVADTLGVSLDDLKTFVGSVNDAVNSFADDATATLPSVGDIIGDLGDDFSPQALLDKLTQATEDIADFQTNLETLAAFPRVQQIAATQGPAVAAALAKPVEDGNLKVIEDLEAQAGAFDLHYAGLDANLRTKIGPQIAEATGLTAQLATDAFGTNFRPEEDATIATHGTAIAIANAAPELTVAGEGAGKAGTSGFSTGIGGMPVASVAAADDSIAAINTRNFAANLAGAVFGRGITEPFEFQVDKMPVKTSDNADHAIAVVNNRGPFARIAGAIFGGGFSSGTGSGAKGMGTAAANAADDAIAKVNAKNKGARSAGASLGAALGEGMQSGINSVAEAVAAAAGALVQAAIDRARSKAKVKSPSLLFAELGSNIGKGMAQGIEGEAQTVADAAIAVVAEAEAIVSNAALSIDATVANVTPSSTLATPDQSIGSGNGDLFVTIEAGAIVAQVPAGATADDGTRFGRGVAQGLVSELAVQTRRIRTNAVIGG